MRTCLIFAGILLLVGMACRPNEPNNETVGEATPPLQRDTMALDACSYVDTAQVALAFATAPELIRTERLPNMANHSACIWSWDNSGKQLVLNVEYNDVFKDVPQRYERYFTTLLDEGEWINPYDTAAGSFTYQQISDLGDEALWSAAGQQLRWRIGNRYLLYLKLQSEKEEAFDVNAFRRLAESVTEALPAVE